MNTFTLVAVIRNQAPYIAEWVAHHLAVGVENFVFCIHGCSDGTARVTRRLAAMGYGAHLKIDVKDDDPRSSALSQIGDLDEIKEADWIGLVNVDQFLNVHEDQGDLAEFIEKVPGTVDAISFETRQFGSNNVERLSSAPITEQFLMRGETNSGSILFAKSLPALKYPKSVYDIDNSAALINHYKCKSQDYLAVNLGMAQNGHPDAIKDAWNAANRNEIEDKSIARYSAWRTRYLKKLLTDKRLRVSQDNGLNWHKGRAQSARDQGFL